MNLNQSFGCAEKVMDIGNKVAPLKAPALNTSLHDKDLTVLSKSFKKRSVMRMKEDDKSLLKENTLPSIGIPKQSMTSSNKTRAFNIHKDNKRNRSIADKTKRMFNLYRVKPYHDIYYKKVLRCSMAPNTSTFTYKPEIGRYSDKYSVFALKMFF